MATAVGMTDKTVVECDEPEVAVAWPQFDDSVDTGAIARNVAAKAYDRARDLGLSIAEAKTWAEATGRAHRRPFQVVL
jgi:hypothetical protein